VGARLPGELGFSDAIVRADETHDDVAGRPRTRRIAHASYGADQAYWAMTSGWAPTCALASRRAEMVQSTTSRAAAGLAPEGLVMSSRSRARSPGAAISSSAQ
jgi:hypothetical protein